MSKQTKDYTFNVSSLKLTKHGVQANGRNAGKPYAMGTFQTTDKAGKVSTKVFKAFDETYESGKGISPASLLIGLSESGVESAYLTGKFVEGRARDANDATKGSFQDFKVAFVETVEAHTAWVESRKAEKAAA